VKSRLLCLVLTLSMSIVGSAVAHAADKPTNSTPPVIQPGITGTPKQAGGAPSDALVLFDGTGFDHWETTKKGGGPPQWKLVEGAMEVTRGGGAIRTREKLGYGHYHVEFRTPPEVKGSGQGRGNSGVFPLGGPEVQVLDSYQNDTYSHGQCGAIYNRYPPMVNACRPPGVWQTYDILVHPPVLDGAGKQARGAAYTVLHNGVLIHENAEVGGGPGRTGQLSLQDHGNPVRYRNIWFRAWRKPVPMSKKK